MVNVGRVPLYLLDSEVPENTEEQRNLTANLYGGDHTLRIQQEKLLGVGGLRALREMNIHPSVCHMNEGHSAFLGLEWMRWLMETTGASLESAQQAAKAGTIFTTHTPVPAGNDEFAPELVVSCFAEFMKKLGISREDFLALGRPPGARDDALFSMTLLALRFSSARNGVSELHGHVSRRMWQHIWPELGVDEVPIGSITNGVHVRTWLSSELEALHGRHLDAKWREEPDDPEVWSRVGDIPDGDLWHAHERCRERLVEYTRRRLRQQLARRGVPHHEIDRATDVLDPKALTIGFARRFATYKRATLLFRDIDRLKRILESTDQPVQVIFAGKAHPRDDAGKDFIRQIVHLSRQEPFIDRFVFLEDYEMTLARYLVAGCDIWLNTPRRPMEASGTSGMKAAVNGVLNLSVLDGWWAEAYRRELGWVIGSGESYDDETYQDQIESEALYDVLEHDVVPLFYDRNSEGLPERWVAQMKSCIAALTPDFSMHRMVKEYASEFYVPASRAFANVDRGRHARRDGPRDVAAARPARLAARRGGGRGGGDRARSARRRRAHGAGARVAGRARAKRREGGALSRGRRARRSASWTAPSSSSRPSSTGRTARSCTRERSPVREAVTTVSSRVWCRAIHTSRRPRTHSSSSGGENGASCRTVARAERARPSLVRDRVPRGGGVRRLLRGADGCRHRRVHANDAGAHRRASAARGGQHILDARRADVRGSLTLPERPLLSLLLR